MGRFRSFLRHRRPGLRAAVARACTHAESCKRELRVGQGRGGWIVSQRCAQGAGLSLRVFAFIDESEMDGCGKGCRVEGNFAGLDPVITQGTQETGNSRGAESRCQFGESRRQVFKKVTFTRQIAQ